MYFSLITKEVYDKKVARPLQIIGVAFLATFCFLSVSCDKKEEPSPKDFVAKVKNDVLFEKDIKGIVPAGTPPKDSVVIIQKYIRNWIQETLMLQQAEENLTKEQMNVEKQLKDYRNSLIIYAYEQELVKQLDQQITEEELEKYYEEHKNDFELKDNIIRVTYIKVNSKAPQIENVRKWYKSENEKDLENLKNYCHQFADNFYFDDKSWLLFNDLLKEIPIKTYNEELFLQNNRLVEVADSSHIYFVNIKGFKIKNTLSPLTFEKEKIRNIILNKRKIELINKIKTDLYKQAEAEKSFYIR